MAVAQRSHAVSPVFRELVASEAAAGKENTKSNSAGRIFKPKRRTRNPILIHHPPVLWF
jgi:hypothetical protein